MQKCLLAKLIFSGLGNNILHTRQNGHVTQSALVSMSFNKILLSYLKIVLSFLFLKCLFMLLVTKNCLRYKVVNIPTLTRVFVEYLFEVDLLFGFRLIILKLKS